MPCRFSSLVSVLVIALSVVSTPDATAATKARKAPAVTARSTCTDCHRFPAGRSHPVAVEAPVESGLPLTADGRMTCLSCHDDGMVERHGARGVAGSQLGLRLPKARLCAACHDHAGAPWLRRPHAVASTRVHPPSRPVVADGLPGLPDADSRSCLDCHDGSVASSDIHGRQRGAFRDGSHPIGLSYSPASKSGRRSRLRAVSALPAAVQLPGGRVGCTSCHDPFSTLPNHLVLANRGSALCFACHAM